ncbi:MULTISPECIES: hypothetical protein [unclassified Paenibacillus]|uniref:hypothetical protein n=1 Tax=unclassified Paenibacillus TaxID=185978 RepID=UPI001AE65286|nr:MULTISPECIES: hypothetical protein [unclassified Paenibacillus]MBP1154685.1 hypothetical protein [Paenibacillus sp. PvP091]MBP1169931.1 hypothetical protein [Paenibacillus sp. PvR098]MBP2440959.1 hypothetical protein [Paenibacillus sp. PvP052]
MVKVKYAECKRVLERSDELCADVEVILEGEDKRLVALFAESEDNDYDMVMVLQKDASLDIDWYDNDLHAAYVDVSKELFSDEAGETLWGPRESFKEQVLSFGGVRDQIAAKLDEAKRQKIEA